jgi:hypothetical protein
MGQTAGTYDSYDLIGAREDLQDKIFNIDPIDCPFTRMAGSSKASATKHEWQTDDLAAAAQNAQIEGDEFAYADPDPSVRVGNYTQIATKTLKITGTAEAIRKAGRSSELGYEAAKKVKELKRDHEFDFTANTASVAGSGAVARVMGGLRAWLETNTVIEAGGADGGYNAGTGVVDAATNGTTPVAFTKAAMDTVIQSVWNAGGDPTVLMVSGFNKRAFSTFMSDTNVAQFRTNLSGKKQGTIIAAADFYISDFNEMAVIPNRFQPGRNAYILDPEYLSIAYLRRPRVVKPAVIGDATNWVIIDECTLVVKNEAAHGVRADLTNA